MMRNPYVLQKKSPMAQSTGYGSIGTAFPSGGPEVTPAAQIKLDPLPFRYTCKSTRERV